MAPGIVHFVFTLSKQDVHGELSIGALIHLPLPSLHDTIPSFQLGIVTYSYNGIVQLIDATLWLQCSLHSSATSHTIS